MRFWILVAMCGLSACAHQPTYISEADQSFLERSFQFERSSRPVAITKETVVLDVRSFLDYQLASLPDAVSINADEFYLKNMNDANVDEKASGLARRLALMGVTPFSHVVVFGYGSRGQGEEGRVALTLLALGIERVQLAAVDSFKGKLSSKKKNQKQNQRYWEPRLVRSLYCSVHPRKDTMFVLNVDGPQKTKQKFTQLLATVSVDWLDFVNKDDFSPNYSVKKSLAQEKIIETSPVMVRGQYGSLATFNMIQLGYKQVCWVAE